MRLRQVACHAVVAVLLLSACAGPKPEPLERQMAVHVESCDANFAMGTVTNGSAIEADVFIEVGAGKAVVWGLAAGASAPWQMAFVAVCQPSVSAYPAGEVQRMAGGG